MVPLPLLVHQLPAGLCDRLLAVPVRRDARTGTMDIAVVDTRDGHAAEDGVLAESSGAHRSHELAAMEAALRRMKAAPERGMSSLAPPIWVPSDKSPRQVAETPLYGTPIARFPTPGDDGQPAAAAIVPPAALDMPIPLTAVRRAVVREAETPPPIKERSDAAYGHTNRAESREFPTLEETLPEPVIELRNVKAVSRRFEDGTSTALPGRVLHTEDAPFSRGPVTARGPYAPNAPVLPFVDAGAILAAMRVADGRDAVIELLLTGVRAVARKVAFFVVKRDALVGLRCTPELGDESNLREVKIPLAAPSILVQALGSPGAQLGRILKIEAHEPLLAVMTALPTEVAVIAVRIARKPALLVLADELGDTMMATRRMEELSQGAGEALARLLRNVAHAKRDVRHPRGR